MPDNGQNQGPPPLYRFAYRVGMEFVAGIFVGVLFGYIFDHYFKTNPWGMIAFILLGAGTGFRNIFRLVQTNESKLKSDSIKKDRLPNE